MNLVAAGVRLKLFAIEDVGASVRRLGGSNGKCQECASCPGGQYALAAAREAP